MPIIHQTQHATVHAGDCLDVLRELPDESVHAVITDPPYGLSNTTPAQVTECLREWASGNTEFVTAKRGGFMGNEWDSFVPPPAVWAECLRVLKPGGHLLAFAGSRTQDLMGMSVRLAGFDIRDGLTWLYGSGMPKGRATLKPASEPIVMARKPFKGSIANNESKHGTGALGIDACRIPHVTINGGNLADNPHLRDTKLRGPGRATGFGKGGEVSKLTSAEGRWPANVITDESVAARLEESRYFYCAKAAKSERPNVDGVSHPTVKPLTLMRYLIRMVTPPGGTILDPFAGSGTTLEAATQEGFESIGIEAHPDYLPLIAHRLDRGEDQEQEQLDFAAAS